MQIFITLLFLIEFFFKKTFIIKKTCYFTTYWSLDDVSEYASSQSLSEILLFTPLVCGGTQVLCGGVPEYPQ